jgi:hypothetical protein
MENREIPATHKEANLSEDAINSFRKIGIAFSPIDFKDVYRITSRDTDGGRYPYNTGFTDRHKERFDYALTKDNIEIGFYSISVGEDTKSGKIVGETGMIHISPALRRKGLGTLVQLLSRI